MVPRSTTTSSPQPAGALRTLLAALLACLLAAAGVLVTTAAPASAAITAASFTTAMTNSPSGDASTSLTIGKPSGTAVGSVLVAQVTFESGNVVTVTPPPAPTGWTLVSRRNQPMNGSDLGQAIYYRVVTAADTSVTGYQWRFSQAVKAAGGIIRYTGVDTTTPIDLAGANQVSASSGASGAMSAPSVNAAANSVVVVFFGLKKTAASIPTPTPSNGTMTEQYEFASPQDVRIAVADEPRSTAGATGPRSSTPTTQDKWVAQMVVLRPANTPPTVGDVAGPIEVTEGSTNGYSVTATDTDSPTLTYAWSVVSGPATIAGPPTGASANVTFLDGPATVKLRVTVSDGTTTVPRELDVSVANAAPVVTGGPDGQAATEGGSTAFTLGSFTDAGVDDLPWNVVVDWGDGAEESFAANTQGSLGVRSHTYADDVAGGYLVTVTVTDGDGASHADTFTTLVGNAAPVVLAQADVVVADGLQEGSGLLFDLGTFSDAGALDGPWAVTVDWGDASTPDTFDAATPGGLADLSHTFADDGTYTVTVTVDDHDGPAGSDTFQVYVADVPPAVTAPAGQETLEGATASFALGTLTDPGADADWTVTVDWGDGSTADTFAAATPGALAASHTYLDNAPADTGTYTVTVSVVDADGVAAAPSTFPVRVDNVAPVVLPAAPQAAPEGTAVAFALGSFGDQGPADAPWDVTVDWGDGSPTDLFSVAAQGSLGSRDHTYADDHPDGPYTVTVTVTDKDGGVHGGTFLVDVADVAPSLAALDDAAVDEGAVTTFDLGSFADPGADAPWTMTVDWGDTTSTPATVVVPGPLGGQDHAFADDGTYAVTVTVTDADGVSGSSSFDVVVANVAPVVTASEEPHATVEGAETSFVLGGFTDPGVDDDPWAVDVDWGDGTTEAFSVDVAGALEPRLHTYVDDAAAGYTVTVTVTDDDGGSHSDSFTVAVENAAPVVLAQADELADEGDTVTFDLGAFSDAGLDDDPWTVDVDWGDGTPAHSAAVTMQGTLAPVAHTYADDGTYTVSVTVTDEDGGTGADLFDVIVSDVPPTVIAPEGQTADEGAPTTFSLGSFTDPGADAEWTVAVDWGDGSDAETFAAATSGTALSLGHTFADNHPTGGTFTVTVTVTDADGVAGTPVTFEVLVANVDPVVSAAADQAASEGETVAFDLGSFGDQGHDDTWAVTVDWGDGTVESFDAGSEGSLGSRPHTYADNAPAGGYTVTVTVTDDDSGVDADTFTVTVANLPPVLTATTDQVALPGVATTFSLGSFTDPGTADAPWSIVVDWGDGTTATFEAGSQGPLAGLVHTYALAATRTVTVTVTDKDGAGDAATFVVDVRLTDRALLGNEDVEISGARSAVTGGVHANRSIRISGSGGTVCGNLTAGGTVRNQGTQVCGTSTAGVPRIALPTMADYVPGAGAVTHTLTGDRVLNGYSCAGSCVVRVTGKLEIRGTVTGDVWFIVDKDVVVKGGLAPAGAGSRIRIYSRLSIDVPVSNAVIVASLLAEREIKLSGADQALTGLFWSRTEVHASGSGGSLRGAMLSNGRLKLSGSDRTVVYDAAAIRL